MRRAHSSDNLILDLDNSVSETHGELPAKIGFTEVVEARVVDHATGEADQDRTQGATRLEVRVLPDGRGGGTLLRDHINKEDNVLYMIGDDVMSEDDQASLCSKFCEVGCNTFGGKKSEELRRMDDELEAA